MISPFLLYGSFFRRLLHNIKFCNTRDLQYHCKIWATKRMTSRLQGMPIHNYIEECIIVFATLRIIESRGLSKNTESIPKKKNPAETKQEITEVDANNNIKKRKKVFKKNVS